jgi:hypothetical protein
VPSPCAIAFAIALFAASVPAVAVAAPHGSAGAPLSHQGGIPLGRSAVQPFEPPSLRMPARPANASPQTARPVASPSPAPSKTPDFNPLVIRREA